MQINYCLPLLFGTKVTSRAPGSLEMTVIVRGVFRLAPGEPVEPIDDLPQLVLQGDTFDTEDDDMAGALEHASDFADFKPKTDVLLRGTCHPGKGRSADECMVSFAVGSWSKSLRVFGRRVRTARPFDAISEPVPFKSMPIVYQNAYGGPEFVANPVGKGYGTPELPTIESAFARRDAPEPAGFAPLSPFWPQRRRKVGKDYGKTWKKTRAPFYSADFDWSYFNAAPEDQQLEGYLRGDEALAFEFLHPDTVRFVTALPGVRARAFCRRNDGYTAEVAMNLDTLVADLDAGRLILLWRGLFPVNDDQLDDVRTLLVQSERIEAPRPAEHYLAELEALDRDPIAYLRDRLVPDEVREKIEVGKALVAKAQAAVADVEAKAALASAQAAPAADDATARVEAMLDRHAGAMSEDQLADKKEVLEKLKSFLAYAKPKLEELKGRAPPIAPTRDGIYDAASAALASEKARAASTGIPMDRFASAEKQLADARARLPVSPEALQGKTPGGAAVSGAGAAPATTPDEALGAMGLSTEPGPRAVVMGRDFSGRDMRGVDLRGALLRGAKFVGTKLGGARMSTADLGGANLDGADLAGADLTSANLSGATAVEAVFDGATVDRAVFLKTDLTGASLVEVEGRIAAFHETVMTNAKLQRSRLHKAVFSRANLEGADFTGAELDICCFLDAFASGALFDDVRMTKTVFLRSKLESASFYRASGVGCSWHGSALDRSDFRYAKLRRAQFNKATLAKASLHASDFRGGRFDRALLTDADFKKADLMSVSFCKATLTNADFSGASLYDAKFLGASAADGCKFEGADLTRAIWEGS